MNFEKLKEQYRTALLDDVIPFWEKHSPDREHGGYFTCLDREGRVYDTDKFVWLQAREVWTFSMLYNRVERRKAWLDNAKHGIDFLCKNGMDSNGDWYFSLDQTGKPLVQPYKIFSYCFAAMALGQYALAADDSEKQELAVRTYMNIIGRSTNPKGQYSKAVPSTRALKSFSIPMIMCNLALELETVLGKNSIAL